MLQQCRTDYELGKLLQLFAAAENLLLDGEHSLSPSPVAGLAPGEAQPSLGFGPGSPELFALSDPGPHLKRLCALSEALRDSSISVSRSILSSCSLEAFQGECSSILEQLQERGMFSLAREVAALAELPVDSVVTHEVQRS